MTATLGKIIADFNTTLNLKVVVGATSATLDSATDDDGVALPTGTYFLTFDGNSTTSKEYIKCTLTSTALTSIQSVSRQGALTSGFARTHRKGATVTITDFAIIRKMLDLLDGTTDFDSATVLGYDGAPILTTGSNEFATVKYADDLAIAGSPDATTATKGITTMSVAPASAATPIAVGDNDPRVPTQDENNALAGTSGVAPSATNKFMDERAMTGIVSPFAGSSAPTGWLLADGTAVSRTTYATLFAVISTTYGVGDGSTTFNVPNLKGKVVVGFNSSETEFDALGETGGSKNHTLTQAELPNVNFTVTGGTIGHAAGSGNGAGGGAAGTLTAITVSSGGSGTAHNNIQPYITLNYIIKT